MNKTPLITVFDDKTEAVGKLIQLLENRLYKPLVDAIHGKDLLWLEQNYKTSRRFYYINQELNQFVGDHDIKDEPQMVVYFNQDVVIDDYEWVIIDGWLTHILAEESFYMEEERIMITPNSLETIRSGTQTDLVSTGAQVESDENYGFKEMYNTEKDIMFYEVTKPHTDRPYVVVIREFQKYGKLDFFSSLFVCTSWGVSLQDNAFLLRVWDWLGMDGECQLEELLRKRITACENGERDEPEVYRKDIESVVNSVMEEGKGCGHKRTRHFIGASKK